MEIKTTKQIFNMGIPWQRVGLSFEQFKEIDMLTELNQEMYIVFDGLIEELNLCLKTRNSEEDIRKDLIEVISKLKEQKQEVER